MNTNSNQKSGSFAQSSERPGRGTDVLTSVLGTLQLCGARYCASDLGVPWGIHFRDRDHPIFHVVDRGAAWLVLPGEVPQALVGGDVVMLAHGHAHTLADQPKRVARVVDFDDHPQIRQGGGPAIFGGGGARTLLVCGEFQLQGPTVHSLIAELPKCIVLRAGEASEWLTTTLRLLAHESLAMEPGSETIMTHLVAVILVQSVRGWLRMDGAGTARQGWLHALRDPVVARALSLLHQRPAHEWTVQELGQHVGLSRSVFSERFTQAVGEPPLSYLTRWRMQLSAARLQASPRESVKAVAAAVGYQSEAAFSRAFRRYAGKAPAEWRDAVKTAVRQSR